MARPSLVYVDVDFGYEGADPLVASLSLHLTAGWTAVVGANGTGKTTLLGLATGRLTPTRGQVRRPERVHLCEQRTDTPSDAVVRFGASSDDEAGKWRSLLGVDAEWVARWPVLSQGERKRLQVAAALWHEPDLLALDEPTNHLDAESAARVRDALATYRGIGLLVSHDRALLDALCTATIVPDAGRWRLVGLVPSAAREVVEGETRARRRARALADADVARLRSLASQRAAAASQSSGRLSKRRLARGDRDGRAKIDGARLSGKDARAGRLLRIAERRVEQAEMRAGEIRMTREFRTGITFATRPGGRIVADFGPASLDLGPARRLRVPRLVVGATDRVHVAGPNGSGKSTMLRALVESMREAGRRLVWVPQEFTSDEGRAVLDEVRGLPPAARGRLMTLVRRLGSDPERLLASAVPSPGEVRKLAIALGLDDGVAAIVLDEPTNHLDLPSIEALETALAASACALVLASHDVVFVQRLATTTWTITDDLVVLSPS